MLYLRMCLDKPDNDALRDEHRAGHRAYLSSAAVTIKQAGPMMSDDDEHNIGSFMIVEADDLATVKRFHDEDPFTRAGLFGEVVIYRWDRHIGN
jgi:uncharacterized protein YciI